MIRDKKKLNRINKILSVIFLSGMFFLVTVPLPAEAANCPSGFLGDMGICITGFGLGSLFKVFFDVAGVIIAPAAALLLQVMSLFTMLAGTFLNFVINISIVNMGSNMPWNAIDSAWTVLRDLANMSFIFILLYTSISLIIGRKSTADVRSLVVKMIIAALLINFSQFFTKIFIDASNLLALTFYNAVAPGAIGNTGNYTNFGLSNSITNVLNPQSIFELAGNLQGAQIITMGIMGSILLLACIFIFIAMSFMFLIRFALLTYVIIFSPIALVADVIPGAKDQFNKWWSTLVNQAFFPAIFFLFMWIALTILNGFKTEIIGLFDPTGGATLGSLGGTFDNTGKISATKSIGAIPLLVNYVLSIIFIVIAFLAAKSMASKAPGGVSKVIGAATGWAGASSLGMAGRFGRGTIGRGAQAIANDKELQQRALSGDMGARLKLKTAQKTAKASFDPRATGLGKTLGAGDAQKGGFVADVKAKDEFDASLVKSLATTAAEKEENKDLVKKANKDLEEARKKFDREILEAKRLADDIPKSPELIAAEATAAEAKLEAERENRGLETDADKAERIAKHERAKAELRKLERIREDAKEELLDVARENAKKRLDEVEEALDKAKKKNQGAERAEAAIVEKEKKRDKYHKKYGKYAPHWDRVLLFGSIKSEVKDAPDKIRKAAQGKSRTEQIAELAAAEEKEKKEKEGGGEEKKEEKPEEKTPPVADSTK